MKNLRFNTESEALAYLAERPALAARNGAAIVTPVEIAGVEEGAKVIRQSKKKANKTELRFLNERLLPWKAMGQVELIGEHESIYLKIANGCMYRTDWPTWKGGRLFIWEVKGAKAWDDAIVKLKVAAHQYTEIVFHICRWLEGEWDIQEVRP